ncbi:MAG: aromatic amino acid lyase [Gammaproteobacteria bacterium]|nr:aromatic amino acid lyase [Gammaproteobacteria bacterium]
MVSAQTNPHETVTVDGRPLRIEDVVAVAQGASLALSNDPAYVRRIQAGAEFIERHLAEDGIIYGVTTGYGDSCTVSVPEALVRALPLHLTRYHGCGLGEYFSREQGRAILATRLQSLAQGFSGVRYALLERLAALACADIVPLIPEEGSVGASGDLTPLSYVAAAVVGERRALWRGEVHEIADIYRELGWNSLELAPKEGLAIMNGTAVMTALACLAWRRADYLSRLSTRITALASVATGGNRDHFHPRLFAVKPHAGQQEVANWLYHDLNPHAEPAEQRRLQDRYSLRCAPHVIGVLRDALPWMRRDIEHELNSANDNPIIDVEAELVLHGGHFYGGHIAFVMDSMKNLVANLADLMDRQLALMVDPKFNHGLPQNLSGARGAEAAINHGFKAVQIGASAWAAEALKLTMPASVFSRSTECHNQDKVSMGTIAARDALRVLQLSEQVAAGSLLAAVQGVELRLKSGEIRREDLAPELLAFVAQVRKASPFLAEDRPLEHELRAVVAAIQTETWDLYP